MGWKLNGIYSKFRRHKHMTQVLALANQKGGVGKTTTIAKLAYRFKSLGAKVLLAAADTFRAAAIEQIETWAERIDGVSRGASARFTSKPKRRSPETTSRSSSAPEWVDQ